MKYTILLAALLSTSVFAKGYSEPPENFSTAASQSQGIGNVTTTNNNATDVSSKRSAASAEAPSVYSTDECPIVMQGSHAVQFIGFGVSTTGIASINAICGAYHLQQFDVVEKMLCNASAEYKKANPHCN